MASECDAAGMPTNSRRMTLDFSEETSQISATIVGTARLIQIFNGNSASDAILPDTETCDKEHQDSPNAPYLSRTNDLSGSHSKTKESISSDDTMQAVSPHSSKYTCSRNLGGFGDMDMFYGGLDKLLGHPSPDLTLQLFVEHNEQRRKGFGCSTEEFIARNYEVATTPQKEYEFVVVADTTAPGGVLPERIPTKIEVYMQESVERMNRCGLHVTQDDLDELGLLKEELIALRLYTGPMYSLYNAVLRNRAQGEYSGKFVTTIHLINSGILKLSKLQFCTTVYRGITGILLPEAFRTPNRHGVRGGVELGFMSCTTDCNIARGYASLEGDKPGTVLEMKMGMFHKGAQLNWLSQHPGEGEILYAPLTGLEVIAGSHKAGQLEIWPVQLTTNLRAIEIEKLISMRKFHHMQTLDILYRELVDAGVPPASQQGFVRHMNAIREKDGGWFNIDRNFSSAILIALQEKQSALTLHTGPLQASFDASREMTNQFDGTETIIPLDVLQRGIDAILQDILQACPPALDGGFVSVASVAKKSSTRIYDVYIGPAGLSLLFLRAALSARATPSLARGHYQTAAKYLQSALSKITVKAKTRDVGFLCSRAGLYAQGCIMSQIQKHDTQYQKFLSLLLSLEASCDVDELLYGRSGYIYSLLFVLQGIREDHPSTDSLKAVVQSVFLKLVTEGGGGAQGKPLTWTFQVGVSGKENNYLGAAHGDAGILLPLLQARNALSPEVWQQHVRLLVRSVDYLISRQLPDGNFPMLNDNDRKHLVHWCHGAPGVTALMVEAYDAFGDLKYLTAARKCGDVCWHRGLLKKGFGLCHGLAGNAYTFLSLARIESEGNAALFQSNHYFRASCFARSILGCSGSDLHNRVLDAQQAEVAAFTDRHRFLQGHPDFPYSLFEGKAGVACFLMDMMEPNVSSFPAYELNTPWLQLAAVDLHECAFEFKTQ